MSLIQISNLTFAYDGSYDNIFENTSFSIDTDWKLGFIGRNGRGKTTFLNLLLKKYEYKGTIAANVDFEYFPYNVSDPSLNTLDIVDQIYAHYEYWELVKELSLIGVEDEVLYRPFSTLSNGEQTKVLLATLFLKPNAFLLIDEPTNHLDAQTRVKVSEYLKSKKGFILISHDRNFLDHCVDHILSINKNSIDVQSGNFSSWYYNKQLQDQYELAENERLKKDIKRLEESVKRTSIWADKVEKSKIGKGRTNNEKHIDSRAYIGEKSRRMQQRRKNLENRQNNQIEEKSNLLKNIEEAENLKIFPLPYHTNRLVQFHNVSLFYEDKCVCKDLDFEINRGDIIALSGKNGCGKSSIIKLICGENITYTGEYLKGSNLKISYVPQDTSFLKGNLTDFANEHQIDESLFKAILRKLDFSRIQFEKNMEDFSGGQKKKVLIAKSLCEQAHLYIWDEPLNFIDLFSRIQIEDLIKEFKPTMLLVEHDRSFTDGIVTKTVSL